MARRQGVTPFTSTSNRAAKHTRSSSFHSSHSNSPSSSSESTDKRPYQDHHPFPAYNLRFWLFVFLAIVFLFHRGAVFAAPSPLRLAITNHLNTTITRSNTNDPSTSTARNARPNSPDSSSRRSSAPQREANIAYFLQISETTINHLPRLLRVLHHPKNVYAIHFDLKIPAHFINAAVENIRNNPAYDQNVHVMPSELITYRGISMLLNTINAMRLLLDKHSSWHYFINLSGADYPLLDAPTQRRLLGVEYGLNYFTFAPSRTWDHMAENRLGQVWYDESLTFRKNSSIGELSRLQVRNPLVDQRQFDVSHAEAWMVSSREFCNFVVRGDMARKMLVAFAYAVDSSEHYFASLAWNHPDFKKSIVPHSLRFIVWMHDGVLSGQHPYNVDERDQENAYKFKEPLFNSVLFFARKFEHPNSELMDYIDERAKDREVVNAAENHVEKKVSSRTLRVSEL